MPSPWGALLLAVGCGEDDDATPAATPTPSVPAATATPSASPVPGALTGRVTDTSGSTLVEDDSRAGDLANVNVLDD